MTLVVSILLAVVAGGSVGVAAVEGGREGRPDGVWLATGEGVTVELVEFAPFSLAVLEPERKKNTSRSNRQQW